MTLQPDGTTVLLAFQVLLLATSGVVAQAITQKYLYQACNPKAHISECGANAICVQVPRCQYGVCVCRLDGDFEPSPNNCDCQQSLESRRRLCGTRLTRSICSGANMEPASGRLLDKNEQCGKLASSSRCNPAKGLICDPIFNRCHCEWPQLERSDGTCYTAGFNESCSRDDECGWMYQGTKAASHVSGNAICDKEIERCVCNDGYLAVPEVDVNYYLPVSKKIDGNDVGTYNISVLLTTKSQSSHSKMTLPTIVLCLNGMTLVKRIGLGGACSYRLTMVERPLVCESGLVCQYCPKPVDDGHLQVMGTCVSIAAQQDQADSDSQLTASGKAWAVFDTKNMANILIAVGAVLLVLVVLLVVVILWCRHQARIKSLNHSVLALRCDRMGDAALAPAQPVSLQSSDSTYSPTDEDVTEADYVVNNSSYGPVLGQQNRFLPPGSVGMAPLATRQRSSAEVSRV